MWDLAAGPFFAAAGLLVVAEVPKIIDPLPLVRALRAAGMPAGHLRVRVAAYLVFTAFVARVLTRGGCSVRAAASASRTPPQPAPTWR